ncbi:hypothetical protein BJX64DRAFT_291311 [Aspergillus heterothallicus]
MESHTSTRRDSATSQNLPVSRVIPNAPLFNLGQQVAAQLVLARTRYHDAGNTRNEETILEQGRRFREWAKTTKLFSEDEESLDNLYRGSEDKIKVIADRLQLLIKDLAWLNNQTADDMYADPKYDVPIKSTSFASTGRRFRDVVETRLISIPQHLNSLDFIRRGALRFNGEDGAI